MNQGQPATLTLDDLIRLAPDQRWPALGAATSPDQCETSLLRLIDEVEQLAHGEVGRGISASLALVQVTDESGYPLPRVRARRVLAMAQAMGSLFDDSLAACTEAIELAETSALSVEAARVRLASMQSLANLARFDEAIEVGEAALQAFADTNEPTLAGRAHLNLGSVWAMSDRPDAALHHFDQARQHLGGTPPLLAQIESNRGIALTFLDRYEEAEAAFLLAGRLFEELGGDWSAAIAEGNLANLDIRQGRLSHALHHYERARLLLERDEATADLARIDAEQAEALAMLGLASDALEAYMSALPRLEAHGAPAEVAACQLGYGRLLFRLDRLSDAQDMLARAEAASLAADHSAMVARCAALRAEIALAQGHPGVARSAAERAITLLADRPVQRAAVEIINARIALAGGDIAEARKTLQRTLTHVTAAHIAPLIADVHELLWELERRQGDQHAADRHAREAIEEIERIRGTLQADRLRSAWFGDHRAMYEGLYRSCIGRRTPDAIREAFLTAERMRGRALLDAAGAHVAGGPIASGAAESPADASLLHQMDEHRRWLNWFYSQMADGHEPDARQGALLNEHEQALASLGTRIAVMGGPASLHAPPMDLPAVQRHLPVDAALISYLTAGDELHAIVVMRDGARAFPALAPKAAVDTRIQRLQFQIQRAVARTTHQHRAADRRLAAVQRELHQLHDLVFRPVRDALTGARELVVIPHGPLHAVPFSALHDGTSYLVEQLAVVTLPSASLLGQLSRDRRADNAPGRPLVVGILDADAPAMADEARTVASILPNARLVLGNAATEQAIAEQMSAAPLVHLACHGRFRPDAPKASGLRLADRWLTVQELYQRRLAADLVTLSGCETGLSVVDAGDELTGLVHALLASGSRSLVVSLWMTNDSITAELMAVFYQRLHSGEAPVRAIRSAPLAALARNPHPAYWAPFVFMGHPADSRERTAT